MEKQIIEICNNLLLGGKANLERIEGWTEQEWVYAFNFAACHGLLVVMASQFAQIKLKNQEASRMVIDWYGQAEVLKQNYLIRLKTMEQFASHLQKYDVDVMFLKGATLALLYPNPEWRTFSDVDYYLYGDTEEGIKILNELDIKTHDYTHHHTQATANGVLLENHYDFFDCENHRCNHILDKEMKHLAETEGKSIHFEFSDKSIKNAYVMTPTMNAIFIMRHMSGHFFAETIPLRMLYDWVLFLKTNSLRVDWDKVIMLYKESGMLRFVEYIQSIVRTKMNIALESCPIEPVQDEMVDRIWDSIIIIPHMNPYKEGSIRHTLFETRTFIRNRWKHKIVYPKESYVMLFFSYVWLRVKKELGLLEHKGHG